MSNNRFTLSLASSLLLATLIGCGDLRVPLGSGQGSDSASIAGNWQFTVKPSSSSAPFTELSGAIDTAPDAGLQSGSAITSVLLAPSSDCFDGAPIVPLHGTLTGVMLLLSSFSINGQQVTVSARENAAGDQLDGTYSVSGGCADHATGALNGLRYQTLSGTFSATDESSLAGLKLQIQQAVQDRGNGTFPVSGTVHLANSLCFTQGVLIPDGGAISGSHVQLVFELDGIATKQLILVGKVNPPANNLSFSQATVSLGACTGDLGALQLSKVE